jgi:hypothetical protein
MGRTAYGAAVAAVLLIGCQMTGELPTQPTKEPASGVITVAIPSIPVLGTPDPKPTPTPSPKDSGCGDPLPEVARMNVKVHIRGPRLWTLDSTPLVGRDVEYCRRVGFTDGRGYCPVRPEGAADRVACETYAVGYAGDTGRPGPTWHRNGRLCTGEAGDCGNHPDNQYLLEAYGAGHYEACTAGGVCGSVEVDR